MPDRRSPRTQAERRAATVDALLEATLASLVDVGLSATTTRAVAERAGVSQGALQHHFATKAAMVDAAVNRAVDAYAARVRDVVVPGDTEGDRLRALLDALWAVHREPLMTVVHEVLHVARTHPETAALLAATLGRVHAEATEAAARLLPDHAATDHFGAALHVTLDAMRGASELASVPGAPEPDWPRTRERLVALFARPA